MGQKKRLKSTFWRSPDFSLFSLLKDKRIIILYRVSQALSGHLVLAGRQNSQTILLIFQLHEDWWVHMRLFVFSGLSLLYTSTCEFDAWPWPSGFRLAYLTHHLQSTGRKWSAVKCVTVYKDNWNRWGTSCCCSFIYWICASCIFSVYWWLFI